MNDFEEADFWTQIWRSQKQQRKIKKEHVENKKEQKSVKSRKVQTGQSSQGKKKRSKFKEAMMERNEKKKEKKKKRKKLEREEHQTAAASNPQQEEKLRPECRTLDFMEKSRTKKVQFASFPHYIRVTRPTFSSSSPKEAEAVRSSRSGPVQDTDSQCPSEDINSQDLFITQKTFRTSPQELSSSEASDRAVTASPLEFNNNRREDPKESEPKAVQPHLDEPFGMSSSSGQRQSLAESSTQTENFFTSELCSFFSFCQRSRAAEDLNGLKPLDLSLPQRVRARTTLCLTMKASGSSTKDGQSSPSPRFQTDLSFSSEEDHPGCSSRREMIQVRAHLYSHGTSWWFFPGIFLSPL